MNRDRKKSILVISGGPSTEHEVSLDTGKMVVRNLSHDQYCVDSAIIHKDGKWSISPRRKGLSLGAALQYIQQQKFDAAFLALHGTFGEDGHIQAMLDAIKLPYTGSGLLSSAMAFNKTISNDIFQYHGLTIPASREVGSYSGAKKLLSWAGRLHWQLVVKPTCGGSSVGTILVHKRREFLPAIKKAMRFDTRVLVQELIVGREVTCAVLEKHGKPYALPVTEIIPRKAHFFDYRAKYTPHGSEEITPARLSKRQTNIVQQAALTAHKALGCSGLSRSDFLLRGAKCYILETNTLPGMTATSLVPQAVAAGGIRFPQLLDWILMAAWKQYL